MENLICDKAESHAPASEPVSVNHFGGGVTPAELEADLTKWSKDWKRMGLREDISSQAAVNV